MASVELVTVSKIYDKKVQAVKDATLSIQDKEFIVLVGPSGCGKSTLLRMIAGLEEITAGTISIGSRVVNEIPPKDRNIAMVFQNYALYPHMTVYDNMAFGLKLRKFNKKEIKKRVENAADILDISDFLHRKPRALSGGQRQRVAVGRAIVRQPEVFLFDEPLSNLDAKLRVQMRIEITKLHQRLGATMVYVTHDQVEAMTMGDRIVVMNDGVIQQMDSPLNLYNNPINIFVAGFIGSPAMNFFEGKLITSDGFQFKTSSFNLEFALLQTDKLLEYKNRDVIMGIRPEHFSIKNKKSGTDVGMNAQVEVIEPMGNELIVYLKTGENNLTVRCPPKTELEIGAEVFLELKMNQVHLFDKDSGMAVI